jgi:hypothetical protein
VLRLGAVTTSERPLESRTFSATLEPRRGGGVAVRIPFDPSAVWGDKDRHYVTGTMNGRQLRGVLIVSDDGYILPMGPTWARSCGMVTRMVVSVVLQPEGPQLDSLPEDVAAALEEAPEARRMFESLAPFYRTGFIRLIETAKRPETRVRRVRQMVAALKARQGTM